MKETSHCVFIAQQISERFGRLTAILNGNLVQIPCKEKDENDNVVDLMRYRFNIEPADKLVEEIGVLCNLLLRLPASLEYMELAAGILQSTLEEAAYTKPVVEEKIRSTILALKIKNGDGTTTEFQLIDTHVQMVMQKVHNLMQTLSSPYAHPNFMHKTMIEALHIRLLVDLLKRIELDETEKPLFREDLEHMAGQLKQFRNYGEVDKLCRLLQTALRKQD